MMDFKNILKKLEELETNEEKVEFLKGLLEELDDEDLGEFRYSSNSNYSNLALYSQQSFDYQTLEGSFNTDIMKQNLVRESILNPESFLTEIEKKKIRNKKRAS